jgi:O-6-methylguanine DNA methyltransferase
MNFEITTFSRNEFRTYLKSNKTYDVYYETAAGVIHISFTNLGIYKVEFCKDKNYVLSSKLDINTLLLVGTDFQIKVWQAALKVPSGKIISYHDLANNIGHKNSYRAVANALGQNKLAYFVPCHRIIRKDGSLGGYFWGVNKKVSLLQEEGVNIGINFRS